MARKQGKLSVQISVNARASLIRIWIWNANTGTEAQADAYLRFLDKGTDALAMNYREGRPVPTRPSYRYMILRRSAGGHGHIVVYEVRDRENYVVDYFHTAQDWQTKVAEQSE